MTNSLEIKENIVLPNEKSEKINLEELPFHELKKIMKEKDIYFERTDKKEALIAMLKAGKTIHEPKQIKKAPVLEQKKEVKIKAFLPVSIKTDLEGLVQKGLKWVINENDGTIIFERNHKVTCNLDSSERAILRAARDSFAGQLPIETGREDAPIL